MGRLINLVKSIFLKKDLETKQLISFIRSFTGTLPINITLYKVALKHFSNQEDYPSNERLEFLGDAVLSLIVAEYLFKKYPFKNEGFLTDIRSRIVNRLSLNELARKIHLDKFVIYNTHPKTNNKFIYGNALEALIGAIYIDHGYNRCKHFVINKLINNYLSLSALIENDTNYKSKIINWAHKNRFSILFNIVSEKQHGPYKEFTVHVLIDDKTVGEGTSNTKKHAEQIAAQHALQKIGIEKLS